MNVAHRNHKTHWHSAFCGATEWELKQNKNDLIFESEHVLSKEPLRMDMLVIRKDPKAVIRNEIGKIFKAHNVIEFKETGNIPFDTQIIVTRELDGKKHASLKILSRNAQEEDVRRFLQEVKLAHEPGDLQNVDAVLQVSVHTNERLYQKVDGRSQSMVEALREIWIDELEEEKIEACTNTIVNNVRNLMKNTKWTAKQAMEAMGIPETEQQKYSSLL